MSLISAFNSHLKEFLNEISIVLPNNADIKTIQTITNTLVKANPSVIIKLWKTFVADKYADKLNVDNISFFLEKDYSEDVEFVDQADKYLEFINRLRRPIKLLNGDNMDKTIKYLQNLTQISILNSK
jgi:hypothetical protein